jgi:TetR/AcrR family fatty acid metabolism transcriptional regulator
LQIDSKINIHRAMAKAPNGKANGKALAKSREEERRRAILKAAVEVFSKKGYPGCRIADVAREANVAYGLVYHYFKNKDELLESVFESGWHAFVARVTEAAIHAEGLEGRVRAVVRVAFEAYRRDPKGVKVLILEVGRSPSGGSVNRGGAFKHVLALAAQLFDEARQRGEVKPELDPMLNAALLFGAIEMGLTALVLGFIERTDDALERAANQVAETFLAGVLTKPGDTAWTSDKSSTRSRVARRA